MTRMMSVGILLLINTVVSAAPVPKDRNQNINLTNTTWVSDGDTGYGAAVYILLPEGKIEYRYGGASHKAGSWTQDGTKFSYELNMRYYWYDGELQGDVIHGKAGNKAGGNWEYKLRRKHD